MAISIPFLIIWLCLYNFFIADKKAMKYAVFIFIEALKEINYYLLLVAIVHQFGKTLVNRKDHILRCVKIKGTFAFKNGIYSLN